MTSGIVLLAHGSRDPEWSTPFERLARRVRDRRQAVGVAVAYLEISPPTLDEAIDAAAAGQARRVLVVPLFLAPGGHTKRDVPALVDAARARHPALEIRATSSIGEEEEVLAALADWIARATG